MGLFDKMKEKNAAKQEKTITKVSEKHLHDGEIVEMWVNSIESVGAAVIKVAIATNERVLLIEKDAAAIIPKENVQSFNYGDIESINASSGAMSNLQIVTGINTITLNKIPNKDVKPFIEYVDDKRKESKQSSTTIINESGQSKAAQLKEFKELLDMDAITQEEFDSKKAQLLK